MNILFLGPESSFFTNLKQELEQFSYFLQMHKPEDELEKSLKDSQLVVIDYEDDEKDSITSSKLIRELELGNSSKSIPIIYVSENDSINNRIKVISSGADDFVDKSDVKSIRLKINSFLRPDLLWQGLNTILVEDDKISAKFISHVLKSKGAKVHHFSDALSAFDYVKENNDIDLILTDQVMPVLTGIGFVKKIRNELGLKTVPIVFISSVQDKAETLEFYKAGGNDYLAKPLIKEELFVKVNQLLENRLKSQILKNQIEELENLNRVKDRFLAVCSHDLRTPLNTILGLTDLIINEEEVGEDVGEYLGQIHSSASDLLELVSELLDVSELQIKKDQVKLESIDISKILQECIRKLSAINTKHINFQFEKSIDDIKILGNSALLTRAFNNILTNSYKFTGEGGDIRGSVSRQGEYVLVSISDTGIGMPENFKDNLFSDISQIGRTGLQGEKSIGLGMSIVKKIIDQHKADIDVVSVPDEGTNITFKFKVVSE